MSEYLGNLRIIGSLAEELGDCDLKNALKVLTDPAELVSYPHLHNQLQ